MGVLDNDAEGVVGAAFKPNREQRQRNEANETLRFLLFMIAV
jgi:hypothetical protein